MAIALRSSSVGTSPSAGTIAITTPTYEPGDLLIAAIGFKGNMASTVTAPAGWTQLSNGRNGTSGWQAGLATFWRWATTTTPASHTFIAGSTASNLPLGIICAYSGVDAVAGPLDGTVADTTGGSGTAASFATGADPGSIAGRRLVCAWLGVGGTATADPLIALPGTLTLAATAGASSSGEYVRLTIGDQAETSTAGTGTRTATATGPAPNWRAAMISLAPGTPTSAGAGALYVGLAGDGGPEPRKVRRQRTGQTSVTPGPSRSIVLPRSNRRRLLLRNAGPDTVWIGNDREAPLTTLNGRRLDPTDDLELNTTEAVRGAVEAGTAAVVDWLEEFDETT